MNKMLKRFLSIVLSLVMVVTSFTVNNVITKAATLDEQVADTNYNLALNKKTDVYPGIGQGVKTALNDGILGTAQCAISKPGWGYEGAGKPSYAVIDLGVCYDASTLDQILVQYKDRNANDTVVSRTYKIEYSIDRINYYDAVSEKKVYADDDTTEDVLKLDENRCTADDVSSVEGKVRYVRVYYPETAGYGMQITEIAIFAGNPQTISVEKCAKAESVIAESKDYNSVSYTIAAGTDQTADYRYNVFLDGYPIGKGVEAGKEYTVNGITSGTCNIEVVSVYDEKFSDEVTTSVVVKDLSDMFSSKKNVASTVNNKEAKIISVDEPYNDSFTLEKAQLAINGVFESGENQAIKTIGTKDGVFIIDLGANYKASEFDSVALGFASNGTYASDYKVEFSADNEMFFLVGNVSGYTYSNDAKINSGKLNISDYKEEVANEAVRYVKVTLTGRTTGWGYCLNEVAITLNVDVEDATIVDAVEIAPPKSVTAVSEAYNTITATVAAAEEHDDYTYEVILGDIIKEVLPGEEVTFENVMAGTYTVTARSVDSEGNRSKVVKSNEVSVENSWIYEQTKADGTDMNQARLFPDTITDENNDIYYNYVSKAYLGLSAEASSKNGGNEAGRAIDNNGGTSWESEHGKDPQYITVNLGNVYSVKELDMVWQTAQAKDFYVEVSTDGEVWKKVAMINDAVTTAIDNRIDKIILKDAVDAQFVRITGTARINNWGYNIYEIAVYGPDEEITILNPSGFTAEATQFKGVIQYNITASEGQEEDCLYNVYLDGVLIKENVPAGEGTIEDLVTGTYDVTVKTTKDGRVSSGITVEGIHVTGACSYEMDNNIEARLLGTKHDGYNLGDYYNYVRYDGVTAIGEGNNENTGADKTIDNDAGSGSRWEISYDENQNRELTVDMGNVYSVKALEVLWETAQAGTYDIYTSIDGSDGSFEKVAHIDATTKGITSGTGNRLDTIELTDEVDARYVKVVCTSRNTGHGYSIWELGIYGPDEEFKAFPVENLVANVTKEGEASLTWDVPEDASENKIYTYEVWVNDKKVAENITDTNYMISAQELAVTSKDADLIHGVNTNTIVVKSVCNNGIRDYENSNYTKVVVWENGAETVVGTDNWTQRVSNKSVDGNIYYISKQLDWIVNNDTFFSNMLHEMCDKDSDAAFSNTVESTLGDTPSYVTAINNLQGSLKSVTIDGQTYYDNSDIVYLGGNQIHLAQSLFSLNEGENERIYTITVTATSVEGEIDYSYALKVERAVDKWHLVEAKDEVTDPYKLPFYYHDKTCVSTGSIKYYYSQDVEGVLDNIYCYNNNYIQLYLNTHRWGTITENGEYVTDIRMTKYSGSIAIENLTQAELATLGGYQSIPVYNPVGNGNAPQLQLPTIFENYDAFHDNPDEGNMEGDFVISIRYTDSILGAYAGTIYIPIHVTVDVPEIEPIKDLNLKSIDDGDDGQFYIVSWSETATQNKHGYTYELWVNDENGEANTLICSSDIAKAGQSYVISEEYKEEVEKNGVTVKAFWCGQTIADSTNTVVSQSAGWRKISLESDITIKAGQNKEKAAELIGTISFYENVQENHIYDISGYNGSSFNIIGNTKYFNEGSEVSIAEVTGAAGEALAIAEDGSSENVDIIINNFIESGDGVFKPIEDVEKIDGKLNIQAIKALQATHINTYYVLKVVSGENTIYIKMHSLVEAPGDVDIQAFQMNTNANKGEVSEFNPSFRVVSRASKIIADENIEKGKIRAITAYGTIYTNDVDNVTDQQMLVGNDGNLSSDIVQNENVKWLEAYDDEKEKGTLTNWSGSTGEKNCSYYAVTFKCLNYSVEELTETYKVRAYAVDEDGRYLYGDTISKTSVYDIAKVLYDNNSMLSEAAHNFLYENVLNIVSINQNYSKIGTAMLKELGVRTKDDDYNLVNNAYKDLYYYTELKKEYKMDSYASRGAFVCRTQTKLTDGTTVDTEEKLLKRLNATKNTSYSSVAEWIQENVATENGFYKVNPYDSTKNVVTTDTVSD